MRWAGYVLFTWIVIGCAYIEIGGDNNTVQIDRDSGLIWGDTDDTEGK